MNALLTDSEIEEEVEKRPLLSNYSIPKCAGANCKAAGDTPEAEGKMVFSFLKMAVPEFGETSFFFLVLGTGREFLVLYTECFKSTG